MNVYIYAADFYCEDCGKAICDKLNREGKAPLDHYDSDEYPKGPYPNGGGEADCPHHCGAGPDCLNAIDVPGCNYKIGAWLENELTSDGVAYVREMIREGGGMTELWAKYYRSYDL